MNIRILALCCALLLAAGCTVSEPVKSDAAPSAEESIAAESLPDASATELEASPQPPLPYEETVAAVTPALAQLAVQHREKYPDTVGWLRVPGTSIDNAVVQSDDPTNEYYLQHDLDGNPSRDGTYSAQTSCNLTGGREGISRNISLFAHNHDENPYGILFAQLKKYKNSDFARGNPYIYFSTPDEDMVWEIFAVFDTVKQYEYIHADPSWARQRQVVEMALEASIHDYGVVPGRGDRFLTLSTCSFDIPGVGLLPVTTPNDYRFVVMARLVNPDEAKKDAASITPRTQFLLPDDFPLFDDYISLEGWNYYLRENEFDHPLIQPLDESRLVLRGRVQRTTQQDSPQDWDATQLPVGTEIYADPLYPRLFVVDYDGERLYYVSNSTRLLLMRDGQVLATRMLDNAAAEILWPDGRPDDLPFPGSAAPLPSAGALVIVEEYRDDRHIYRYPYYLALLPSAGGEVMVRQRFDGYFYEDAATFQQLLDMFSESLK